MEAVGRGRGVGVEHIKHISLGRVLCWVVGRTR